MRACFAWALLCALLLSLGAPTVHAHHPGHVVSLRSGGSYNPFLQGRGGPNKRLSYLFDWSHLDNSAGDLFLNQLEGEYAIWDWFSFRVWVPMVSLQLNFRPSRTGLGDVGLGFKGRLLEQSGHRLLLGLDNTFPSGDREAGTGAGSVVMSPYLAYEYDAEWLQVFTSTGISVALDNDPEPTLLPNAGIAVPILRSGVPLSAFLSLQGQVFFADESFTPGSAKAFLVPGLIVYPMANKRLSIALSGKVSVIDTLSVRDGLVLEASNLALAKDVLAGVTLQINYSF